MNSLTPSTYCCLLCGITKKFSKSDFCYQDANAQHLAETFKENLSHHIWREYEQPNVFHGTSLLEDVAKFDLEVDIIMRQRADNIRMNHPNWKIKKKSA